MLACQFMYAHTPWQIMIIADAADYYYYCSYLSVLYDKSRRSGRNSTAGVDFLTKIPEHHLSTF